MDTFPDRQPPVQSFIDYDSTFKQNEQATSSYDDEPRTTMDEFKRSPY
jgi:hypothetical protein